MEMETNQVTEEGSTSAGVKSGRVEEEEEERVTSSSDCSQNKKSSDPVKAFQEDMDMEGLSGGLTFGILHDTYSVLSSISEFGSK